MERKVIDPYRKIDSKKSRTEVRITYSTDCGDGDWSEAGVADPFSEDGVITIENKELKSAIQNGFRRMKISLEKAKQICTKTQYGEATWWEVLQLKVYLLFCKECAEFSEKNSKLTSLCERIELFSLSEEDKATMKERLQKKLQ